MSDFLRIWEYLPLGWMTGACAAEGEESVELSP